MILLLGIVSIMTGLVLFLAMIDPKLSAGATILLIILIALKPGFKVEDFTRQSVSQSRIGNCLFGY